MGRRPERGREKEGYGRLEKPMEGSRRPSLSLTEELGVGYGGYAAGLERRQRLVELV